MSGTRPRKTKIGLALAGGGPEGAVYEIGALRALEESLEGIDFNDLDIYVGISAGAFIAACLNNGMTLSQLARAIVKHERGEHPYHAGIFFTPAVGEFLRGGIEIPRLLYESLIDFVQQPHERSLLASLGRLSRALPVGLFRNEPIREYLANIFSIKGRTDDFRKLPRPLYVVATDLDSGEPVRFGEPGFDDIPISTAIQASSALPGLYQPVSIRGRNYVDGVLQKTLHASVALERDVDLLLCLNPIVPVDTAAAVEKGVMRRGTLINRGLPTVLSQTFRTMIHSRLRAGLANYEPVFPGQEVLLIEPKRDDYRMFFTNIFRFSSRKEVVEHAYQSTLRELRERRDELKPMLARHGVRLRDEVLDDESRTLWRGIGYSEKGEPLTSSVSERLGGLLDRVEALLDKR